MELDGREYVCSVCGRVLLSDRSTAEATDEAHRLYDGELDRAELRDVCDDCFPAFMEWMHATYGPPPWPVDPTTR